MSEQILGDELLKPAMPEKRSNKISFKAKIKLAVGVLVVLLLIFYWIVFAVNQFFNSHVLKFQSPVQKPIWIEKRVSVNKPQSLVAIAEAKQLPDRYKDSIDQYIYEKFGKDGDLAVRISRAENGSGQCDRVIVEPNGTVSVGRFMINSVHLKRFPMAKLIDCKSNVDVAFQLFQEQGNFTAWSVYKSGAYKLVDIIKYLN